MADLRLPVPDELLDALAEKVAEIVLDRLRNELGPTPVARWMRTKEAADYLGWTRSALYSRVSSKTIPHYKVDGILLFKKDELDAWLEQYRQDPRETEPLLSPKLSAHTRRKRSRITRPSVELPEPPEPTREKRRRERPLPPPLGGDEAQKDLWARELEISPAELDEMSPRDFDQAWKARNQRLEEGGVFDHIAELSDKHGWEESRG